MGFFGRKIREAGVALVRLAGKSSVTLISEDGDDGRVENFKKFKRAYEKVPLITAIIDVQADQTVQNFYFEGPNQVKLEKFADKVNLMRFFHRATKSMLLYGNAYVEIVKEGKDIIELKILDPIWMNVYRDKTGEVIGYGQIIEDKKCVLWGTTGDQRVDENFRQNGTVVDDIDAIAHFKYNVLASAKYGKSIIEPLMYNLQMKLDMEEDLKKVIFKYVAPLIWAKVGNDQFPANETIVENISSTLNDLQAESEITTSHLVDLQVLDFNSKGMDIKTPIEHMETQIVTGGQVPPVMLGRISNNKGDKQAEVQLRNFGRHIKAIQREIKYEFEDKIIATHIGTKEDKLMWERADEREYETDVDILRGLVTDGVITPQKANDLLPPRYHEKLPPPELSQPLNQNSVGPDGQQKPRPNQMKTDKVKDQPNDPTKTTKNPKSKGRRIDKSDKFEK